MSTRTRERPIVRYSFARSFVRVCACSFDRSFACSFTDSVVDGYREGGCTNTEEREEGCDL